MRISRFRLRTLLILVMLAGVGVWGYLMRRRSVEYARIADFYARMEGLARSQAEQSLAQARHCREMLETSRAQRDVFRKMGNLAREFLKTSEELVVNVEESEAEARETEAKGRRLLEQNASLKQKYRRAARFPFLPVAPDPPIPD